MAIVLQTNNLEISLTAQDIMNDVAQDMRQQLQATGTSTQQLAAQVILLDYVNRTQMEILSYTSWPFMTSNVKRFITTAGQGDYWIGALGQNPQGTVDTGLSITDMHKIQEDSVYDRTNFKQLLRVSVEPLNINTQFRDSQGRPTKPQNYRQDRNTPYIVNIYPPPDNQANYQIVPEIPYCKQGILAGSLAATTYYVRVTYVDSEGGESAASSPEAKIFVPANYLLTVIPPNIPLPTFQLDDNVSITQWNCYISTTPGNETKQNATPLGLNTAFTLPTTGLINGTSLPGTVTIAPLNGYVIEFQYTRSRLALTNAGQYLQIPDVYREVLTSGVNMRVARYLKHQPDEQFWMQMYQQGIIRMIRDRNMYPKAGDFMRPDPASIGFRLPGIETLDFSLFTS